MPSSLFSKILIRNQMVNGKLNVDESILKKIYNSFHKNFTKLEKQKKRQEDLIKLNIKKLNDIKIQIKRNSESYEKAFQPSIDKISLLYKQMGDAFYIKARFYWHGKQREVQVGSVSSVVTIINNMIDDKILTSLDPIENQKLKWENIIKNSKLIEAIKKIASLKSQDYIVRKLINDDSALSLPIENQKNRESSVDRNADDTSLPSSDKFIDSELDEGESWYDRWRKENL